MRDELLSSINVTSSQDERDFYARFVALKLEGLTEGAPLRTEVVNRLQELVAGDGDGQDVLLSTDSAESRATARGRLRNGRVGRIGNENGVTVTLPTPKSSGSEAPGVAANRS
jgi:hypothetical protein